MLRYTEVGLSEMEVPRKNSICIYLSGCPCHCACCHYPALQKTDTGLELRKYYRKILDLYQNQAACVCFMGEGDGSPESRKELTAYSSAAQKRGLQTCLYSGRDTAIEPWMRAFDYVKVGSYQTDCGPLTVRTTNQRMYQRSGGRFVNITDLFWDGE